MTEFNQHEDNFSPEELLWRILCEEISGGEATENGIVKTDRFGSVLDSAIAEMPKGTRIAINRDEFIEAAKRSGAVTTDPDENGSAIIRTKAPWVPLPEKERSRVVPHFGQPVGAPRTTTVEQPPSIRPTKPAAPPLEPKKPEGAKETRTVKPIQHGTRYAQILAALKEHAVDGKIEHALKAVKDRVKMPYTSIPVALANLAEFGYITRPKDRHGKASSATLTEAGLAWQPAPEDMPRVT